MNVSEKHVAGGSIDLIDLFSCLWRSKWWIAASVALFTLAFGLYAYTATPLYRSVAVLAPVNYQQSGAGLLGGALGQLGGLASIVGLSLGGNSDTEEALAVLQSREFTEKFIQDKELLPKFFSGIWDGSRKTWRVPQEEVPTLSAGNSYFDKRVRTVSQDKRTGLVSVQMVWRDRNEASEWANELVERLNEEMRMRAREKAEASLGFLQSELAAAVDIGTKDAINRLIEAQIKQRMLINVTKEFSFSFVDRALPSDKNDYLFPKRRLLTMVGFAIGCLFGGMVALLRRRFR